MLKLKIKTKRMKKGKDFCFYSNREQYDNIKEPFNKKSFQLTSQKQGNNRYLITISKIKA